MYKHTLVYAKWILLLLYDWKGHITGARRSRYVGAVDPTNIREGGWEREKGKGKTLKYFYFSLFFSRADLLVFVGILPSWLLFYLLLNIISFFFHYSQRFAKKTRLSNVHLSSKQVKRINVSVRFIVRSD